ncbi:unnamed protein product, partial [Discosporangium mesarthrocarpum]
VALQERAVSLIKRKYATMSLTEEDIHTCLYSMCDNDSFLNSNRVPIDKMIGYLKKYFSPDLKNDPDGRYCLAISAGEGGARLTHSHARQYNFALQVLAL